MSNGDKVVKMRKLSATEYNQIAIENDADVAVDDVAGPSNSNHSSAQTSPIFKLTVDCCDEIFDYLPLNDLYSFGQTSRAMQRVAGEYFKRNYSPGGIAQINPNLKSTPNIFIKYYVDYHNIFLSKNVPDITAFMQFIRRFYIDIRRSSPTSLTPKDIDRFSQMCDQFKSLTQLKISIKTSRYDYGDYFKAVLLNIETMMVSHFCWDAFNMDLYGKLLKYCPNLKYLYMFEENPSNESWLHQKYPKLLQLSFKSFRPMFNLNVILEGNPNIRTLSTNFENIYDIKDKLLSSTIKLDRLIINVETMSIMKKPFSYDLLNEIYDKGVFKRLSMRVKVDNKLDDKLASIHGLDTLIVVNIDNQSYNLPILSDLKELAFKDGSCPNNLNSLATSLVHLERLFMYNATINDVLLFMRRSPKLNKMKVLLHDVAKFGLKFKFDGGILNLSLLNKEREKLLNARKVTIYVPEDVYIKTKWAMNGDTNRSLVEMKRNDSYEWSYI